MDAKLSEGSNNVVQEHSIINITYELNELFPNNY